MRIHKPGSPGFGTWPATKWPWFGELAGRGYLGAAVHRSKNPLMTVGVARLLNPICRAEIKRMRAADPCWGRLLDHLDAAGPSSIRRPAHRARAEAAGAEVAANPVGAVRRDRLAHAAGALRRGTPPFERVGALDQAYPSTGDADADPGRALKDLIAAAVHAAVLAPGPELRRWFSWQWYWTDTRRLPCPRGTCAKSGES